MNNLKTSWWRYAAALIAIGLTIVGIMSMFEDTRDPLYQRALIAVLLVGAAGLIIIGLVIRANRRKVGCTLIAIGTLPAVAPIVLFWYPPALAIGVVSSLVIAKAVEDAQRSSPASSVASPRS